MQAPARVVGSWQTPRAGGPAYDDHAIPGLAELWQQTHGDERVCIAVLDGPVDVQHDCFGQLAATTLETVLPPHADDRIAARHGTHIASVIFGRHGGPVRGLAPRCRGLFLPIFSSSGDVLRPCSQLDLARAISEAVRHGAQVINISGGEFSSVEAAGPLLAAAVRECYRRDVLIVAAAGNQGCACLHVPAALPSVLAVGAMDGRGEPLPLSNWGGAYARQGLLAPGESILGASPGGGVSLATGTSAATAIVSGVAALLLSLQWKLGQRPSPQLIRDLLLQSARGCAEQSVSDCRRLLAGRLNLQRAVSILTQGVLPMSEVIVDSKSEVPSIIPQAANASAGVAPSDSEQIHPSACSCTGGVGPRFVYALGRIGYDLVSETRLDSVTQHIAAHLHVPPERGLAFDPHKVLAYVAAHPFGASTFEWTLIMDGTPVYAIRPQGAFAGDSYAALREFLKEQLEGKVDRVAVAGVLAGTATLLMGQTVPVIVPEPRGLYSWTTAALIEAVIGRPPAPRASAAARADYERKRARVQNFLERLYYELRNLGVLPQDRATNFAASNAFELGEIYKSALQEEMELDTIKASPSPIARPGSDCWDLEIYFFYPEREVQTVRKVYRYTVDVSDVVPATIGPVRSWFTR
jgi:hypothetical protein